MRRVIKLNESRGKLIEKKKRKVRQLSVTIVVGHGSIRPTYRKSPQESTVQVHEDHYLLQGRRKHSIM